METPKVIWGRVVSRLREQKNITLHITCGNILDVEIENGDFIIKTSEKYIFDIVRENLSQLQSCFSSLGYEYSVKIQKIITQEEIINEDIEKLRKIAGDYLKIK